MSRWVDRNPFLALGGLLSLWLAVFCAGFIVSSGWTQVVPPLVPPSEHDARLVALDKEAVEAAYRDHVQRMYSGWMKDDAGQPTRALTGVRQAQRAYIASMDAIKRREQELKTR